MKAGLEDVIAGESGICYIDGEKGILAYRGYNIHELAPNSTFEETSHLLWFGRLPTADELKDTTQKMTASRALADGRSEEHTSELQSLRHLVCRLLLEKKKTRKSKQ